MEEKEQSTLVGVIEGAPLGKTKNGDQVFSGMTCLLLPCATA